MAEDSIYLKEIAGAGRGGERLLDALAAGIGPTVRDWLNTAFPRVEQGSIGRCRRLRGMDTENGYGGERRSEGGDRLSELFPTRLRFGNNRIAYVVDAGLAGLVIELAANGFDAQR